MCLLFHSSQNYYARPMDLLVTWGSNLAESSHHHSLANFSQSGFCQQLITFGQVSIVFSQTDWVLVPFDIQQCSEDDLKSYTSNRGGECHRVGYCLQYYDTTSLSAFSTIYYAGQVVHIFILTIGSTLALPWPFIRHGIACSITPQHTEEDH